MLKDCYHCDIQKADGGNVAVIKYRPINSWKPLICAGKARITTCILSENPSPHLTTCNGVTVHCPLSTVHCRRRLVDTNSFNVLYIYFIPFMISKQMFQWEQTYSQILEQSVYITSSIHIFGWIWWLYIQNVEYEDDWFSWSYFPSGQVHWLCDNHSYPSYF